MPFNQTAINHVKSILRVSALLSDIVSAPNIIDIM